MQGAVALTTRGGLAYQTACAASSSCVVSLSCTGGQGAAPLSARSYLRDLWAEAERSSATTTGGGTTSGGVIPPPGNHHAGDDTDTRPTTGDEQEEASEPRDRAEEWSRAAAVICNGSHAQQQLAPGGSLAALIGALYRVGAPVGGPASTSEAASTGGSVRHVHLLPRHPNLAPVEEYTIQRSRAHPNSPEGQDDEVHQIRAAAVPLTLHALMRFFRGPGVHGSASSNLDSHVFSPAQMRFLVYQLLSCLSWLHARGLVHGALSPRHCLLSLRHGAVWLQLDGFQYALPSTPPISSLPMQRGTALGSDSLLAQWWSGSLSNFDYLLRLNAATGRQAGGLLSDQAFQPVLPWVVDFTATTESVERQLSHTGASSLSESELAACIVYRDLSRSKYRLAKGDEQLDFQFASSSSSSHAPYHVTEPLSELTYVMYRARVTPLSVLRRLVRVQFVAEEYPASVTKVSAWTPDEAIVDFYSDASSFKAAVDQRAHGMRDLEVPNWLPVRPGQDRHEAFVQWHRGQLESPHVSRHLHQWIDLNFGALLSGPQAVHAKNVPMAVEEDVDNTAPLRRLDLPRRPPFTQLFDRPHPPRQVLTTTHEVAAMPSPTTAPALTLPLDPLAQLKQQLAALNPSPLASTPLPSPAPLALSPVDTTPGTRTNGDATASPAASNATPLPRSLDALHSFEYFHACDAAFEAAIEDSCYEAPPREHIPARSSRVAHRSHRRSRSDSEESDEDEDDIAQAEPCAAADAVTSLAAAQADDVFRFGLVVAEVFLGRPVFPSRRSFRSWISSSRPNDLSAQLERTLPLEVASVVRRCLQRDWRSRVTLDELLHEGGGMFSAPRELPPHGLPGGPLRTTGLHEPFAALHRFMVRWRARVRRLALHTSHAHSDGLATAEDLETSPSPPPAFELLTPFHAPSSRLYPSSDLNDPVEPAHTSAFTFETGPAPSMAMPAPIATGLPSLSHTCATKHTRASTPVWSAGESAPFWACSIPAHSRTGGDATAESIAGTASALQWLVREGFAQLRASAPSTFVLFVPHVMDLLLAPPFLHSTPHHALVREVLDSLARLLGPTDCERVLQPFLEHIFLCTHTNSSGISSSTTSFQQSFVFHPASLRFLRARTAWRGLPRSLLALLRNSLLSPRESVAARAAEVLREFVLVDLAAPPMPPSQNAVLRVNQEEILVFEILAPLVQRLAASPTYTKIVPSTNTSGGGSKGGAAPHSSVEKVMQFLLRLMPDLPIPVLSNLVLPNVLALVERGAGVASGVALAAPSSTRSSVSGPSGGGGGYNSGGGSSVDLDAKLSHGLDLLFAMLPDLSNDVLHAVLNEGNLVKSLLLSVGGPGAAILMVGGSSPAPTPSRHISASCMRKVLQLVIYAAQEFSVEPASAAVAVLSGGSNGVLSPPQSKDGKLGEKVVQISSPWSVHTRFAPVLPFVSEFLRLVVSRLEKLPPSSGVLVVGEYTASDLRSFLGTAYVSLSAILGRNQLQYAVVGSDRYERLIAEHAKLTPPSIDANEQARVRQHALQGRTARTELPTRDAPREVMRRALREAAQAERIALSLQLGVGVAGEDAGAAASSSPPSRNVRDDTDDRHDDDHAPQGASHSPATKSTSSKQRGSISMSLDDSIAGIEGPDDEDEAEDEEEEAKPTVYRPPKAEVVVKTEQRSPATGPGSPQKKKKGFFSTGIFAPRSAGNSTSTTSSSSATTTPASAVASVTVAAVASSSSSVSSPTPRPSPVSAWTQVDFGELLLPPPAFTAGGTFAPQMRGVVRAHASAVTCLDADALSGLFISGARSGDSAPTVKLWSACPSQGGVRPLRNYAAKVANGGVSYPRQSVLAVKLLTRPHEPLSSAFAYCDGTQLYLIDIETNKPIMLRQVATPHASTSQVYPVPPTGAPTKSGVRSHAAHSSLGSWSDSLAYGGLNLSSTSAHFSRADLMHVGGVSCFDYLSSLHSLVVGTSLAHVRMLDLRTGGGCFTPAWTHAPSSSIAPAVRCVATHRDDAFAGGVFGGADTFRIYSGLSTGEVAVFDARTGVILHQWRAHDASLSQLVPFHLDGCTLLVTSGLDHVICVWIVSGMAASASGPVLHQRFSNLEDNARGLLVRPAAAANSFGLAPVERELICGVGSRLGVGPLASPRGPSRLSSRLVLAPLRGLKAKAALTATTTLHAYDLTLLAQDDGKIVLAK